MDDIATQFFQVTLMTMVPVVLDMVIILILIRKTNAFRPVKIVFIVSLFLTQLVFPFFVLLSVNDDWPSDDLMGYHLRLLLGATYVLSYLCIFLIIKMILYLIRIVKKKLANK